LFSKWCTGLRWKDVGSREKLAGVLLESYSRRTTVVQLGAANPVADWSGFIEPFLRSIEGHTGPHVFGFTRGAGGIAQMRTKFWARSAEWVGDSHGDPIQYMPFFFCIRYTLFLRVDKGRMWLGFVGVNPSDVVVFVVPEKVVPL